MNISRRNFLAAASLAAAVPTVAVSPVQAATKPAAKRIKLGISSYSYWHFKTERVPIETVIEKSAPVANGGSM